MLKAKSRARPVRSADPTLKVQNCLISGFARQGFKDVLDTLGLSTFGTSDGACVGARAASSNKVCLARDNTA